MFHHLPSVSPKQLCVFRKFRMHPKVLQSMLPHPIIKLLLIPIFRYILREKEVFIGQRKKQNTGMEKWKGWQKLTVTMKPIFHMKSMFSMDQCCTLEFTVFHLVSLYHQISLHHLRANMDMWDIKSGVSFLKKMYSTLVS